MKIRCGSHQQNRSIVRPGLSLMAAKVALTAEEFRENSQRSIALFNTEKLSTDSTHVLKSAYCNSVHFCRCNLHGACGGKGFILAAVALARCCNLHGACGGKASWLPRPARFSQLQSARGVWRQRENTTVTISSCNCCNLHGACGGKAAQRNLPDFPRPLQSARGVWRQSFAAPFVGLRVCVAICTGRVEAKIDSSFVVSKLGMLQSARGVWRQSFG